MHLFQKGQRAFRSIWPHVNSFWTQGDQFLQPEYFSSLKKMERISSYCKWLGDNLCVPEMWLREDSWKENLRTEMTDNTKYMRSQGILP